MVRLSQKVPTKIFALALIKKTSFEKAKKKFPFILRLNQVNRPLNGLVHIQSFSEDIEFEKFYDEENEKWHILFQIWRTDQIKKKMISGKPCGNTNHGPWATILDQDHQNGPRLATGQSISSIGRVPIEILPGKRHIT